MKNISGKSIGRYHILEQLGQGGMATVYKAYDTRLEREVAIKLIRKDAFPAEVHDRVLQRFDREAKSLAKLSHPNIVKVYDYGEYEGAPYLVMELIDGGSLKEYTGQPIPYQEAAQILLPIVRALSYAHERKILHRDIKPGNILLSQSGEVILTDFGIAKVLENSDGEALTGTNIGVGTPEYMAPEQGLGKDVNERADIYSLGIVFYELLTGIKPYQADTPLAVLLKQVNDPIPRPTYQIADLPDGVEKIILKAMSKEAENRYHTMNEFVEALEKVIPGNSHVTNLVKNDLNRKLPHVIKENEEKTVDRISTEEIVSEVREKAEKQFNNVIWWKWLSGSIVVLVVLFGFYFGVYQPAHRNAITDKDQNSADITMLENNDLEIENNENVLEIQSTMVETPSSKPSPAVLYSEDFEDEKTQGITYIAGNWQIVEDETGNHIYELDNSKGGDFPGFFIGDSYWRNYAIQFRLRILDPGKGWTIVYFRQNYPKQYVISIEDRLIGLHYTETNDRWQNITSREYSLNKDQWHDVRIEANGEEIKLYIDDGIVINTDDSKFTSGGINIQVGQYSYIQLDDIIVTKLDD